MLDSEFNSFNNSEKSNDNPWDGLDMVDISEEASPTGESAEQAPSLENRIRTEMTLQEISQLDIKNLPEAEYAAVKERLKQYRETGNAGPIAASASEESKAESTAEAKERAEKTRELKEKVNRSAGGKEYANKVAKKVAAIVGIGAVAAGMFIAGQQSVNAPAPNSPEVNPTQIEENEEAETEIGIKDGYGEKGMYLSENKPSELAFGSAVEVAEVCDGDECEMIKYAADNEIEAMAAYMAYLPEQLQPEGFKGLSIAEIEAKLESLSDEEYERVQQEFNDVIDQAFTRDVEVSGPRANVLIDKKDPSGGVDHDNMEAVQCVTNENSTMRQLYWTVDNDANSAEIGSMTVKIIVDENGNIIGGCIQPIDEINSPLLHDLKEKKDEPKEEKEEEPPEEKQHEKKNEEAEKKNAGPRVDKQPLDESKTPKTTEKQDQKPVQEAHEQVSSGNTAGSDAEKKKQEAVDNSSETKKNNQESTSHAGDTAQERADQFENGDF